MGAIGAKWDETSNRGGSLEFVEHQFNKTERRHDLLGKRSLKVTATLGKNTGGGLTKWFNSADQIFIRFYTKVRQRVRLRPSLLYAACQQVVARGVTVGVDLAEQGQLPNGEERFSTAIEPWGNWGKWPPPGRWNFYSYWHTMAASPDGKYWGNGFRPRHTTEHSARCLDLC